MSDKNALMKKTFYSLLIVFVIMVGVLFYFVATDKNLFKDNTKPSHDKDPDTPDVSKDHTNMDASYFESLLNSNNVSYLENGFSSIEDLTNQDKLKLLFLGNNEYINKLDKVTGEEVNNYLGKYYNTTIINENVNCGDYDCYLYDSDNDLYEENFKDDLLKEEFLKSYSNRKVYSKTTNYDQKDNTYIITRYELYQAPCVDCTLTTKYFSSLKDANNDVNPLIEIPTDYTQNEIIKYNTHKMYSLVFETNFQMYKDSIPYSVYTFKKVNDNYILVSYVINGLD